MKKVAELLILICLFGVLWVNAPWWVTPLVFAFGLWQYFDGFVKGRRQA